jgi:hypothetical protein
VDVQDSAGLAGLETALWVLVPIGAGVTYGLYRWLLLSMEKRLNAAELRWPVDFFTSLPNYTRFLFRFSAGLGVLGFVAGALLFAKPGPGSFPEGFPAGAMLPLVGLVLIVVGLQNVVVGYVLERILLRLVSKRCEAGAGKVPGTPGKIAGAWAEKVYAKFGNRLSLWPAWIDVEGKKRLAILSKNALVVGGSGHFIDAVAKMPVLPIWMYVAAFMASAMSPVMNLVVSFYLLVVMSKNIWLVPGTAVAAGPVSPPIPIRPVEASADKKVL